MRISFSCPYFVLEFVLLAQYLIDALDEDVVGRIAHGSVPMTGYLIKLGIGTTYKSHHSPHIGILLVSAKEFYVSVARYQDEWGGIFSYVEEGSILVDDRLEVVDAIHLAISEVANHLTAEWNQTSDIVGIHPISIEPFLVQSEHCCDVAASRMTRNKNLLVAAIILVDIFEYPSQGSCAIIQALVDGDGWEQAVVHAYDGIALVHQL